MRIIPQSDDVKLMIPCTTTRKAEDRGWGYGSVTDMTLVNVGKPVSSTILARYRKGIASTVTARYWKGIGANGDNMIIEKTTDDGCVCSPDIRFLGNLYGKDHGAGFAGAVFDPGFSSPTINTCGGGNRMPMILVDGVSNGCEGH